MNMDDDSLLHPKGYLFLAFSESGVRALTWPTYSFGGGPFSSYQNRLLPIAKLILRIVPIHPFPSHLFNLVRHWFVQHHLRRSDDIVKLLDE